MARPLKNNADYFSHDADMRNDTRIRALRRKFGNDGYTVWCMMLEYLSGCDYFEFDYDDLTIELIAGDFDIEPELLISIIQYMVEKLRLLTSENGKLMSLELKKRFEPMLLKRELQRK